MDQGRPGPLPASVELGTGFIAVGLAHLDTSYWRGPVWAGSVVAPLEVTPWGGEQVHAEALRRGALDQLSAGGFVEYFEPFTGEPLGSDEQSWTAAVALDWLAHGRIS